MASSSASIGRVNGTVILTPVYICEVCNEETSLFCAGCLKAVYCCRKHQKTDWRLRHSKQCSRIYPKPCSNFLQCGRSYHPDEHSDEEYCNRCGELFPSGVCVHYGGCSRCQEITDRWAVLVRKIDAINDLALWSISSGLGLLVDNADKMTYPVLFGSKLAERINGMRRQNDNEPEAISQASQTLVAKWHAAKQAKGSA